MLANYSYRTVAAAKTSESRRKPLFHRQYIRSSSVQTDAHPPARAIPIIDGLCVADPFGLAPSIRTRTRIFMLSLGLVLISGCAGEPYRPVLPVDHPANAAAEQAPEPAPSTSLVNSTVESVAIPSGAGAGAAASGSDGMGGQGHKGHQMQGHAGHQM